MKNLTTQTTWTGEDWEKFTTWLKAVLHTTEAIVTFTKKDGTERVMKCTLNPSALPAVTLKEDKAERKKPVDTVAVYDLETQGWRSFNIKSVKMVTFRFDNK